jgi:membrane associated rhomboid family serine protease
LNDLPEGAIREGEPPIVPKRDHAAASLPNYWLLVLGPVVGAMLGLVAGYLVYGALRGGGGYYGEIRVYFEYHLVGTLVGFLFGLAVGFWLGLRVCRRTTRCT